MWHFKPRIKRCFQCCHCVKLCRPILYLLLQWNGSAWKMTDQSCIRVSLLCVSSHALLATSIIRWEAEECNCSEQRWNDISADRSIIFTSIIATSCASLYWRTAQMSASAITTVANLSLHTRKFPARFKWLQVLLLLISQILACSCLATICQGLTYCRLKKARFRMSLNCCNRLPDPLAEVTLP